MVEVEVEVAVAGEGAVLFGWRAPSARLGEAGEAVMVGVSEALAGLSDVVAGYTTCSQVTCGRRDVATAGGAGGCLDGVMAAGGLTGWLDGWLRRQRVWYGTAR